MSYPVLFQPAFERETLATVFTNKTKGHYVCTCAHPGQCRSQIFYHTGHSQPLHDLFGDDHLVP